MFCLSSPVLTISENLLSIFITRASPLVRGLRGVNIFRQGGSPKFFTGTWEKHMGDGYQVAFSPILEEDIAKAKINIRKK